MAQQTINIGSSSNDGTGDPLRTAFNKINENFTELYGTSAFGQQVTISGNSITANSSNADLVLAGSGTGGVVASSLRIDGTSLSSSDSTVVSVNEGLNVDGSITASGDITASGNIFANGNINLGNASGDQTKVVGVFEADNIQIDGTTITTNTTNGSVTITGNATGGVVVENLTVNDNAISSPSNSDISIQPGGTGDVILSALRVNGTTLDSSDSSKVTIAEAVDITGAVSIGSTLAVTSAATLSSTLAVTGTSTFSDGVTAESLTTNTITANGSNAAISIQPSGTGDVILSSVRINGTTLDSSDSTSITVAENMDVTGTLTTADVSTTGNTTISGALTTGSVNVGDLNITADGTITSDTNGDINIDPAGTGAIVLTGAITHAGTQTTTGQLNVDNIRVDGNAITATNSNGGITISPDGTGTLTLNGNIVAVTNELAANDIAVSSEIQMGSGASIVAVTTNSDLVLQANGTGKIDAQVPIMISQFDTVTNGSPAISLTTPFTKIDSSGGTVTLTLAAGETGQIKVITMTTAGNTATLTQSNGNLAASVATSIAFDAVGETATLMYQGNKWVVLGTQGATIS
jgi:hypothetical protein